MIEITPSAQEYFAKLIAQQEMDDIGLHLSVMNPGTPNAACDLQFHVAGEAAGNGNGSGDLEKTFEYESFKLYVPHSSERWLTDAKIDFEKDDAGGQLNIKAPGIKEVGDQPGSGFTWRYGYIGADHAGNGCHFAIWWWMPRLRHGQRYPQRRY
jgi:Fe/S biogenesis protein NfuA